jgi:putative acetyltransferase
MIRKFTPDDTDQIVSIWRQASAIAHPFLSDAFIASETDALRNIYLAFAETWVIEDQGSLIGFVALVDSDGPCELAGLFLRPDQHGQGFGKAMVDHAVAIKGPLMVEVFEKNAIGRRFYSRYGFTGSEQFVHDATGQSLLRLHYSPAE